MAETETTPTPVPAHRHRKKKSFNWEILAVLVPLALAVLGWAASIEVRMSQHASALELSQRVKNIEDLMLPVLADWKAQKELNKLRKELGLSATYGDPTPFPPFPSIPTVPDAGKLPAPKSTKPSKPLMAPSIKYEDIENKAKDWAESQMRQSLPRVNQTP